MPTKPTPTLTIELLHEVLSELGELARAEGKVIEVAIYTAERKSRLTAVSARRGRERGPARAP